MATSEHRQSGPPQPRLAGGGSRFPFKTVLAILVLADALIGWHFYVDSAKGLAPGILAETFSLRWPHPPAPVVPNAPPIQPQ